MLGFALADTPGDGRAFRNPDAVLVLLECGDELHTLILTRKFKVSRVDGGGGLSPDRSAGQGESVRRVCLAEFGVPIKTDSRIIPRAAYFVRIFAIVGFGREVDEEDFIGGDGFEAVEYSWGNLDKDSMMFADDDAVGLAVGGAFWAGIVEADFGHSVNDGHTVGLFFV